LAIRPQYEAMRKTTRERFAGVGRGITEFTWNFPQAAIWAAMLLLVGFCVGGCSRHQRDKSLAKEHAFRFLAANSGGEAMFQLETCLVQYSLMNDGDAFPDELGPLGADGSACVNQNLISGPNNVNYRFAYFPGGRDAKDKPHSFTLYGYPLAALQGQPLGESVRAEYFANEDGIVLVRDDFGTVKEHVELFVGMPKTLRVLSAQLSSGKPLPTDQTAMLNALGPEGSPGFSTVPKGYAGLWTSADNDAAVVWTNLSEGYLFSYRPEHKTPPTHFVVHARPVFLGIRGVDQTFRRVRHYYLDEMGVVRTTSVAREANAQDPEVSNCEMHANECEQVWVTEPNGKQ
jgi:hypothetical protein